MICLSTDAMLLNLVVIGIIVDLEGARVLLHDITVSALYQVVAPTSLETE
jgi:hypothetical protein